MPTKVLFKYSDLANIFSLDLTIELFKNININQYTIKLIEGK